MMVNVLGQASLFYTDIMGCFLLLLLFGFEQAKYVVGLAAAPFYGDIWLQA